MYDICYINRESERERQTDRQREMITCDNSVNIIKVVDYRCAQQNVVSLRFDLFVCHFFSQGFPVI